MDGEVNIEAIGNGQLVRIGHEEILVEEAEGLFSGGGGESNEVGVEVLERMAPLSVDGAVTPVGDDDVEGLSGSWAL